MHGLDALDDALLARRVAPSSREAVGMGEHGHAEIRYGHGFALCLGVLSLALLPLAFIYGISGRGTAKAKAAQATTAQGLS